MGGAMLIVGAVLYGMADRLRSYGRFLLTLPPISVGAYIYVLNKVNLPEALVGPANLKDFLMQAVVGAGFFHHLRPNPAGVSIFEPKMRTNTIKKLEDKTKFLMNKSFSRRCRAT